MLALWVYLSVPVISTLSYLSYKGYQQARYDKYITLSDVTDCSDADEGIFVFGFVNFFWPLCLMLLCAYSIALVIQFSLQGPGKLFGYLGKRKDLKQKEHQKWLNTPVEKILGD